MEGMELLNFKIISNVGDAKSYLFQALKAAREENFEEVEKLIELSESSLRKAHDIHMQILQKETKGEEIDMSLLLIHAEDQMMTTELLRDITKEIILVHKKYSGADKK